MYANKIINILFLFFQTGDIPAIRIEDYNESVSQCGGTVSSGNTEFFKYIDALNVLLDNSLSLTNLGMQQNQRGSFKVVTTVHAGSKDIWFLSPFKYNLKLYGKM